MKSAKASAKKRKPSAGAKGLAKSVKKRATKRASTRKTVKGKRWAVVSHTHAPALLPAPQPYVIHVHVAPPPPPSPRHSLVPTAKMPKKRGTHATKMNGIARRLEKPRATATGPKPCTKNVAKKKDKQHSVYVLQLEDNCVYVGKTSRDVQKRLAEHMRADGCNVRFAGAAFTKLHKPTGKLLPRLGNLEGKGDGPERDETLRQMYKRGFQRVRGWKYVRPGPLSKADEADIESNIRELFDLCRRCGKQGHFTMRCSETKDRLGRVIQPRR